MLTANSKWLSQAAYSVRHAFYNKKTEGFFFKAPAPEEQDPLAAMANQDLGATSGMMMSQFGNMGISIGFGYIISEFFSGFVVAKTPFPLTFKFKFMLQSGINLPALDVNYVSSMSWYMFCLMASGALVQLLYAFFQTESNVLDNEAMMQAQMGIPPAAGGGMPGLNQPDVGKQFKQAMDALELHAHRPQVGYKRAPADLLASWKAGFC